MFTGPVLYFLKRVSIMQYYESCLLTHAMLKVLKEIV